MPKFESIDGQQIAQLIGLADNTPREHITEVISSGYLADLFDPASDLSMLGAIFGVLGVPTSVQVPSDKYGFSRGQLEAILKLCGDKFVDGSRFQKIIDSGIIEALLDQGANLICRSNFRIALALELSVVFGDEPIEKLVSGYSWVCGDIDLASLDVNAPRDNKAHMVYVGEYPMDTRWFSYLVKKGLRAATWYEAIVLGYRYPELSAVPKIISVDRFASGDRCLVIAGKVGEKELRTCSDAHMQGPARILAFPQ